MDDEITNLHMALSLFSKTGSIEEVGSCVSTSIRLPLGTHTDCKAIAQHSGQSLNRVIIQLVLVGLDSVMECLPEADIKAINRLHSQIINAYFEDEFKGTESGVIE